MSDQKERVCGMCGQTYIGFCNHGTMWEGQSYTSTPIPLNTIVSDGQAAQAELTDALEKMRAVVLGVPSSVFKSPSMMPTMPAPANTRFICRKCRIVFEQSKTIGLNYCVRCNSTKINVAGQIPLGDYEEGSPIDLGKVTATQAFAMPSFDAAGEPIAAVLPRCSVCGECPTADFLADQIEGWLCCEPLPILKSRRIISGAA